MVSGSHFLPVRPALCVKWMPACAVTSVKRRLGGQRAAGHDAGRGQQKGGRGNMFHCWRAWFIATPYGRASRGALVVVDRLALVVVFGTQHTGLL
jgi:hypothetical protein